MLRPAKASLWRLQHDIEVDEYGVPDRVRAAGKKERQDSEIGR